MKTQLLIFCAILVLMITGCGQADMSTVTPVPTTLASADNIPTILSTSTPLSTYTPLPTAVLRPTTTPYPTIASLSLPTHLVTPTSAMRPLDATGGGETNAPQASLESPTVGADAPDLAPILLVIDTDATCRGSSQFKEALFQLGVTNRGNTPVRDHYTIVWTLGWDDYKGLIRTTEVDYHEWGLQWTVWLENKYFWVPCDASTTFTATIQADVDNTIAELDESNNYAEQSYTITYVP